MGVYLCWLLQSPGKLLAGDGEVEVVAERAPALRHAEHQHVVVALLLNLLVPGVVKSVQVKIKVRTLLWDGYGMGTNYLMTTNKQVSLPH